MEEAPNPDPNELEAEPQIVNSFPFAKIINPRDPEGTKMHIIIKTKEDFEPSTKLILQNIKTNPYCRHRDLRSKTKAKFSDNSRVQALLKQNDFWQQQQTQRYWPPGVKKAL